ncbi:uncharacterized protein LOC115447073 [Manduca sexta]|uniref:uncharacterized protein LOC115447073 n=1 Tax=Manduca sexta TaxID=7130 RepID=UPI001181E6CD|nr:uncharacterized protein LOC115447073 [Manduca sexta]
MYTDASTQYAIDENIPNNEQNIIDEEYDKRSYENKRNDAVLVLKEEKSEEPEDIHEAVEEWARRSSGVSDFNDVDCGEPATGQHLRINFAFTEDDNIELENKCRSFWKFIASHPHLEQIKVLPTNDAESTSAEDAEIITKMQSNNAVKTAVQWMEHDDVMKTAMRTKFRKTYCELDRGDYCDGRKKTRRNSKIQINGRKGDDVKALSDRSRVPSADELKTICQ